MEKYEHLLPNVPLEDFNCFIQAMATLRDVKLSKQEQEKIFQSLKKGEDL